MNGSVAANLIPDFGVIPSLAIGEDGLSRISYARGYNIDINEPMNLYFAEQQKNGTWEINMVDQYPQTGLSHTIRVNSDNMVHMTYISYYEELIVHVYEDNQGWHQELVGSLFGEAIWDESIQSMELKDTTVPCVAYRNSPGADHQLNFCIRT